MNISTSNVNVKDTQAQKSNKTQAEPEVKFSEELKDLKGSSEDKNEDVKKADLQNKSEEVLLAEQKECLKPALDVGLINKPDILINNLQVKAPVAEDQKELNKPVPNISDTELDVLDNRIEQKEEMLTSVFQQKNEVKLESYPLEQNPSLEPVIFEKEENKENVLNEALNGLNNLVNELNQSEEKKLSPIKKTELPADNKEVGEELINNDFSIQENKDVIPQMSLNMNFSGGQPFSSFMNNDAEQKSEKKLSLSAKDLAEEAEILSTMAENIAIANKKQVMSKTQKMEVLPENTVKYDTVIMTQADVQVFTTIVEKGEINLKDIVAKDVQGATQVSKTLADMLAKSMENNQPLRIDFDNDISVIIRISRDGKISADFLPSSQVAEAYLKENLPLLRQRFEDNNIDYESLNHRNSKGREKDENRKKGRNNE